MSFDLNLCECKRLALVKLWDGSGPICSVEEMESIEKDRAKALKGLLANPPSVDPEKTGHSQ